MKLLLRVIHLMCVLACVAACFPVRGPARPSEAHHWDIIQDGMILGTCCLFTTCCDVWQQRSHAQGGPERRGRARGCLRLAVQQTGRRKEFKEVQGCYSDTSQTGTDAAKRQPIKVLKSQHHRLMTISLFSLFDNSGDGHFDDFIVEAGPVTLCHKMSHQRCSLPPSRQADCASDSMSALGHDASGGRDSASPDTRHN